jgi:hypothetical protein
VWLKTEAGLVNLDNVRRIFVYNSNVIADMGEMDTDVIKLRQCKNDAQAQATLDVITKEANNILDITNL